MKDTSKRFDFAAISKDRTRLAHWLEATWFFYASKLFGSDDRAKFADAFASYCENVMGTDPKETKEWLDATDGFSKYFSHYANHLWFHVLWLNGATREYIFRFQKSFRRTYVYKKKVELNNVALALDLNEATAKLFRLQVAFLRRIAKLVPVNRALLDAAENLTHETETGFVREPRPKTLPELPTKEINENE